jgi:4-hydroxymandelate oxidase
MTLPDDVVRYVLDGGASGETTAENRRALDKWRLVPRVLADVSSVSTAARLLDVGVTAPLAIAPMAALRLVHPDGELAVARAAAAAGLPMVLALSSTTAVERIGAVDGVDLWFQLYPFADDGANRAVIERAVDAGARALVVTVDMPPPGRAPAIGSDVRLPPGVEYAHHDGDPAMSPRFVWSDLERLVDTLAVPVVVKGVLDRADVERAAECGAAAVVVSNHGGRVHDGLISAIDALDAITTDAAAAPRLPLFVDGGIEPGADVVRALALGASAVLLGRRVLWALATGGEAGVGALLDEYIVALERSMAVIGAAQVGDIGREHVRRAG